MKTLHILPLSESKVGERLKSTFKMKIVLDNVKLKILIYPVIQFSSYLSVHLATGADDGPQRG